MTLPASRRSAAASKPQYRMKQNQKQKELEHNHEKRRTSPIYQALT
jgi:hypothetical protein